MILIHRQCERRSGGRKPASTVLTWCPSAQGREAGRCLAVEMSPAELGRSGADLAPVACAVGCAVWLMGMALQVWGSQLAGGGECSHLLSCLQGFLALATEYLLVLLSAAADKALRP